MFQLSISRETAEEWMQEVLLSIGISVGTGGEGGEGPGLGRSAAADGELPPPPVCQHPPELCT